MKSPGRTGQDAGAFAAQPEPEHGSGNVQMAEEASDDQATAGEAQNPDYGSLNYGDSFDAGRQRS